MSIASSIDLSQFWEQSEYADKSYTGATLTDELITSVEKELGYKLPPSYIDFMRYKNGGIPKNTSHRTSSPTSWANDHIAIHGLFSIGKERAYSLCGEMGSKFWIDEWEYPAIGIYFADCPSAGHDMVCLDYRKCGPTGEPEVVHVDEDNGYKITFLAKNFESFVTGLEPDKVFGF